MIQKKSVAFVLLGLLSAGCQPSPRDSAPELPVEDASVQTSISAQRELAMAAKDDLFSKLSARLMEALDAGDPASAISVCKQEAPRIAAEVGDSQGLRIGRTSFRLRNPKNTPPGWAQSWVDKRAEEPEFVNLDDGQLGALLPIKLQPLCMTCHGPKDQLSDEIQAALATEYPNDQATGFQAGDLRGWFWIEVPAQ